MAWIVEAWLGSRWQVDANRSECDRFPLMNPLRFIWGRNGCRCTPARLALLVLVLGGGLSACGSSTRGDPSEPQRLALVRSLESQGVRDSRTLAAMRIVPRHEFVPPLMRPFAYEDTALPIGLDQTISQPYIVAIMTEAIRPEPGMKVLEIGTGSGYQAAVLAEIGCRVYTIEILKPLADSARARLVQLGYGAVKVRHGDGYLGWPEEAPFDAVLLTAAPDEVPQALVDQLDRGGRLVAPVGPEGDVQNLILLEKDLAGRVKRTELLPVRFVPMIKGREVPGTPGETGGEPISDESQAMLELLLRQSAALAWDTLGVGERVGRFAHVLEGKPYLDGTLEAPGPEACRITTEGFDCVTLMEVCLNLARVSGADRRWDRADVEDVRDAVTFTRYRGGRLAGYSSRLHYTSEWIADNVAKGVVEDVTPSLGGVPFPIKVDFMSTHPDRYPALVANPGFVDSMRAIEARIRKIPRTYIPRDRIAAIEPRLRTGDLVAVTTSIAGLDYAHTGVIVRGADGVARLLHASSKHRRVVLDDAISRYVTNGPTSHTGITVVRPLEPDAR